MGRRRVRSRVDAVDVSLLGTCGDDSQVQDLVGSSRRRSSTRQNGLLKEKVEVRGASARCSVSQVYEVMQGLSEKKRELVRETGFGGLLYFPPITHMYNKFAVWVMCCVDALEQCIVIDDDKKIKFDKNDVGLVFGIPTGGKKILPNSKRQEVVSRVWCEMIGIKDSRNRTIKALLEVIQREHGSTMSYRECVSFKLAFVVYVLSTVLAPGSRYDHVYLDYLDALEDPKEISSYDWSEFVFMKIIAGINQMRTVLRSGRKVPNITVCSLFLQVIYLDSIDVGHWRIEDKSLPRVRFFSGDRLKYMIAADAKDCSNYRKLQTFGSRPLLPPGKVCYSWGRGVQQIVVGDRDETEEVLWKSTVSLCRLHDMPNEQASVLFDVVARIDLGVGARITAAVASFVDNYVRGRFRHAELEYLNGRHMGEGCSYEGDVFVNSSHENGESSSFTGVQELTLCTACFDIKDPWDLGFNFRYSRQGAVEKLSEICSGFGNGKEGFMIGVEPKVVTLKISELLCKIFGSFEPDVDFVDALLACMKCRDATLYGGLGRVRWRHFVHCQFMESLLARTFDSRGFMARSNFDIEYVGYDVSSCKMVFFPARLADRWVCYAWRVDVNKMVVFDPLSFMGDANAFLQFHKQTFELLRDAVTEVQGQLCSRWSVSASKSSLEFVNVDDGFARKNGSGFGCLYFCCMFDGLSIRGGDSLGHVGFEAPVIVAEALDAMKL